MVRIMPTYLQIKYIRILLFCWSFCNLYNYFLYNLYLKSKNFPAFALASYLFEPGKKLQHVLSQYFVSNYIFRDNVLNIFKHFSMMTFVQKIVSNNIQNIIYLCGNIYLCRYRYLNYVFFDTYFIDQKWYMDEVVDSLLSNSKFYLPTQSDRHLIALFKI